jgi:ParB-like chromosome segregation protein Spo0J
MENLDINALIDVPKFRNNYKNTSIEKLVMSICEYGQVIPILVTSKYEIVNGYKRVEAMKILGFKNITVKIIELDEPKR